MGLLFDENSPPPDTWRTRLFAELRGRHCGIHNFSLGSLEAYFRLGTLPQSDIDWQDEVLTLSGLPGSARTKTFLFGDSESALARAAERQALGVVYAMGKHPLPKRSAFREVSYELGRVFDRASYPTARKRRDRLQRPFKRLEQHGVFIRQGTPADLPAIEALHGEWVKHKMADPKTVRIMFPKARYMNAARASIANPKDYRTFCAFADGALIGIRSGYIEDGIFFDIVFFSAFWLVYSQFVEDMATWTMFAAMSEHGCHTMNCGTGLNKSLNAFKAHWPASHPVSFAYGKLT